ncbi:MAG TPA: tyrosine-type recombinase/integrase [Candidatus Binatia bacterium]|jgi:integrase|nr:tyrosine-type recombinase/integrase [Candidatus Binatia bacterium]
MKNRFRLIQRGLRGGTFYCVDSETGRRESLGTKDSDEAAQIVLAKNQSVRQPALSLQMAKAFLSATDDALAQRTWQQAIDTLVEAKHNSTKARWQRAVKHAAFDRIRQRPIIETHAEHFLAVLKAGTVSTNQHLRQLQNFALDLNWLPRPIIPRRQWPRIRYHDRRAITRSGHEKVVAADPNAERRLFYEVAWHLGASQTDIALLTADNIDWPARVISFQRLKTRQPCIVHFGDSLAAVLEKLPTQGLLFPAFSKLREGHRSTHFKRACKKAGVQGVTLHSYRYAWAERARIAGYPERFPNAMIAANA